MFSFLRRLPQDDAVLARLGESQLPKPLHAVNVVTVDVTGGEGGKVGGECGEAPVGIYIAYYCILSARLCTFDT